MSHEFGFSPAGHRRSGQQRAQVDPAGRRGGDLRAAGLGHGGSPTSGRRRSPSASSDPSGTVLMTADDILAGKAGFQKADLMDYGSLYGMGSYYRPGLHRLDADPARRSDRGQRIAQAQFGKPFDALPPDQQAAVRDAMREQLQARRPDAARRHVPDALAGAITTLRDDIAQVAGDHRPRDRLDARAQPDHRTRRCGPATS